MPSIKLIFSLYKNNCESQQDIFTFNSETLKFRGISFTEGIL
jgi:hypothetical protein